MAKKKKSKLSEGPHTKLLILFLLFAATVSVFFFVTKQKEEAEMVQQSVEGASTASAGRPTLCRGELRNYSLINNCGGRNYRYASVTCNTGRNQTIGDRASCKSSEDWKKLAKELCGGRNSCVGTPTPPPSKSPYSCSGTIINCQNKLCNSIRSHANTPVTNSSCSQFAGKAAYDKFCNTFAKNGVYCISK